MLTDEVMFFVHDIITIDLLEPEFPEVNPPVCRHLRGTCCRLQVELRETQVTTQIDSSTISHHLDITKPVPAAGRSTNSLHFWRVMVTCRDTTFSSRGHDASACSRLLEPPKLEL